MAGLCLAVAAGQIALAEARASMLGARPASDRAWSLPRALTFRTARSQMIFCLRELRPQPARQGDRDEPPASVEACLSGANALLDYVPSLSLAHLVRAAALSRQGRAAESARALKSARETGAFEGWMALARLRVALDLADAPGAMATVDLPEIAIADLSVVAGAPELSDRLAALYLSAPRHRAWLLAGMEQQPEAARRRFLASVRRLGTASR